MNKDTTLIREKSTYAKVFEPQPETNPLDDLDSFIEEKTESIRRYSQKDNPNQGYIDRQVSEILALKSILDKLDNLKLYHAWVKIEAEIKKHSDNVDGVTIKIPLRMNAKAERFLNLDLR